MDATELELDQTIFGLLERINKTKDRAFNALEDLQQIADDP